MKQPLKEKYEGIKKELASKKRELKIETALEKVRARTMSMQKSEELAETSFLLFQQFKKLGATSVQISIGIFNEEKNIMELYTTLHGAQWKEAASIDLEEPVVMKKIHTAWKKKKNSLVIDLTGSELKKYNKYRKSLSNLDYKEKRWVIHVAFFSKGVLTFSTTEPLPNETIKMLERFAAVFDGTYTRFLDLQKAESHTREAKIEAALERIRASSMGMHKSDELIEIVRILDKQLHGLGIHVSNTSILTDFEITNPEAGLNNWLAVEGQPYLEKFHIPLIEDPISRIFEDNVNQGIDFYIEKYSKQAKNSYFRKLFKYSDFKKIPKERQELVLSAPGWVRVVAIFKNSILILQRYNLIEFTIEEKEIFKRFAKVFEQSYRRFLDLQKAEAQAREAQIEASLERVRAKAMAMHKSEDLNEAILTVFEELEKLNLDILRCGIGIMDKESRTADIWTAVKQGEKSALQVSSKEKFDQHPLSIGIFEAWEKQENFSYVLKGKDLDSYYEAVAETNRNKPESNSLVQETRDNQQFFYTSTFRAGNLYVFSGNPYPEEHLRVIQRFSSVLNLTFNRFLDLQKAEAQAREEQIELSLERVRAKTMAMHNSNDVGNTVVTLFEELIKLGLNELDRCGIGIFTAPYVIEAWTASKTNEEKSELMIGHLDMKKHPLLQGTHESWENKKQTFQYILEGDDTINYFNFINNQPDYKGKRVIAALHDKLVFTCFFFKEGCLYTFSSKEISNEKVKIFNRFAGVFGQTYRRYLDLQKAEAQAREAQIELSLERVRAKAMAMHKSTDLLDVISVLADQFQHFGFTVHIANFNTNYQDKEWHLWLWVMGRVYPHQITVPYFDHPYFNKIRETLDKGLDFNTSVFTKEEKDSFQQHFYNIVGDESSEEHKQFVFNTQGFAWSVVCLKNTSVMIGNYSAQPYSDEQNSILRRFGNVFEQTYTRFLDLQKAEAQAEEARIESALEKVRSTSLAMHKSEELQLVVNALEEKFKELGMEMDPADSVSIGVYKKGIKDFEYWIAGPYQPRTSGYRIPHGETPMLKEVFLARESDAGSLCKVFSYEEKKESFKYFFDHTELKYIPDERKKFILAAEACSVAVAFSKHSWIQIVHHSKKLFNEERLENLKRFARVFDQAYVRFLDLQKAEAQAREAQIQLALERVRAKTMAMFKSDELAETTRVLFTEFKELNVLTDIGIPDRAFISIVNENKGVIEFWITSIDGSQINRKFEGSIKEPIVFSKAYKAWKKQEKSLVVDVSGNDLIKYLDYLKSIDFPVNEELYELHRVNTVAFFSKGFIGITSLTLLQQESIQMMERFAGVFDITYTRFLDLQKAEAQAREAEIELALERVRAKTMSMQKTSEFAEVINVIGEQFIHLGFDFNWVNFSAAGHDISHGIDIWNFFTIPNVYQEANRIVIPVFDHPVFRKAEEAVTEFFTIGNGLSIVLLDKKDKDSFLDHLFANTVYKDLPDELKAIQYNGAAYVSSNVVLKDTWLSIGRYNPNLFTNEENEILRRFAGAFGQAYTRLLDLQKAEAQAREAQIEASLERIRSHTMGMQKSNDLRDVAALLSKELVSLGITHFATCGYVEIEEKKNRQCSWLTDQDGIALKSFYLPLTGEQIFNERYDAWKRKDTMFRQVVHKKELNTHLDFAYSSGFGSRESEDVGRNFFPDPTFFYSCNFSHGYLSLVTGIMLSEEQELLMARFTRVFEQTYSRFLDLQKAEAQAREAQIEAALERVRGKAMAMQSSEELAALIGTVFTELTRLDFAITRCVIWIFNPETKGVTWWMANSEDTQNPINCDLPYNPYEPYLVFLEQWQKRANKFQYELSGTIKKNWDDYLFSQTGLSRLPVVVIEGMKAPEHVFLTASFNNFGAMNAATLEPLSDEHLDVLLRFAKVFDLTYTRFNDLKQAEAQAREATIEASLERVRGKAMAMHTSKDLAETIKVFYHEMELLSVTPRRCGVGLLDRETHIVELSTMNTTEEGNSIEVIGKINMVGHPVLEGIYDNWLQQKEYHPVLRGNEIKEYYKLLRPQISYPDYPHDAVQFGYFFYFPEGGVYAWTNKELGEDELKIYRRFTSVLSLTYKRYKDLTDSEARTKEAIKQASLDRVRGEIASMRATEDLQRITPLIFKELTALGVPFFRCGVFIINESENIVHAYLSAPDGHPLAVLNLLFDSNELTANSVQYWRKGMVYHQHWNKEEFIEWTQSMIKQGQIQNQQTYQGTDAPPAALDLHFVPFAQGMLYVGNSIQLNDEEIDLVKSLAEAFSIAYSRYEDFTKLEHAKQSIENTLMELKATQKQLVQSEKMASLGELTAGIAHEIQNPLNFVNNFSEINTELIDELQEEAGKGNLDEVKEIANNIKENEEKINHHGKRAGDIVKGMLQHSRSSTGVKEPTDINALADEYLRLSYHGLRAKDKSFNAKMETNFDKTIGEINIIPQDIGRVLLNLLNNAFYAVNEQKNKNLISYEPTVSVTTKKSGNQVIITVSDNGNGIPQKIVDKIFQPFFTTKPTGLGTGLGLSLSYDIIKAHGGEIKVESEEGEGTEFIIQLPVN